MMSRDGITSFPSGSDKSVTNIRQAGHPQECRGKHNSADPEARFHNRQALDDGKPLPSPLSWLSFFPLNALELTIVQTHG